MKIFIENSGPGFCNFGDNSMLQMCVSRLQKIWPDAVIEVVSGNDATLQQMCPGIKPIDGKGREMFFCPGSLLRQFSRIMPDFERRTRVKFPEASRRFITLKKQLQGKKAVALDNYFESLYSADLFLATGGGYITDSFGYHGNCAIDTLHMGILRGKPTALLGQGIGPIEDPILRANVREVFPQTNLIALREKRTSYPLLKSLGISDDKIMVTGDDAVEFAYQIGKENQTATRNGLGINLRVAEYSKVDNTLGEAIGSVFKQVSLELGATLTPIPIAACPDAQDDTAIRKVIQGAPNITDEPTPRTTEDVIKRVSQCRLVITGSYHAGVFALSQGIPAICLVRSSYYADKFEGLADMFGGYGCQVFSLDQSDLPVQLATAIRNTWNDADKYRTSLIERAEEQIRTGHLAYQRLADIVAGK